jgi:hypothetical protein
MVAERQAPWKDIHGKQSQKRRRFGSRDWRCPETGMKIAQIAPLFESVPPRL